MAGSAIRISILADAKNAVAGMKDTERAAQSLGSKFRGAAGAALKYAAAGAALGAGAAVVGLAKLAQGAAEDQQAAALLAKSLKNATGATDAQVAAVEDYVSKVGVATGVTDDELRPALSKLVTATGDVKKAQELTNLALDVSAGSGKSLEQVTTALAKAQNGSVAGLSKLGIATKDANGETISFADAQDTLGKKFGGAAATKADTLQGKIDRLKLVVSEAGESIGYKLIPFVTMLADFIVTKGVPAVINFGGEVRDRLVPILSTIGSIITGTVIPAIGSVIDFFVRYQAVIIPIAAAVGAMVAAFTLYQGVIGVVSAVTKAYTAIQAALNLVMSANPIALVVLALVGLAAGLVVAYQRSETFRDIVNAAFGVVKDIVGGVINFFTDKIPGAFNTIVDAAKSVVGWVKSNWPTLLAILTGPIGLAVLFITKNWDTIQTKTQEVFSDIKTTVTDKFNDVVNFIKAIPGKITALGSDFKQAGTDVMNKIIEGIKGAAGFINNIGDSIWQAVKGSINSAIDVINSALEFKIPIPGAPDININPPNIPHLASGGITNGPTLAVVGDNPGGREAIIPLDKYDPFGGGTTNVYITVEVSPTADKVDIGREIASALGAYSRAGGRVAF